MDSQNAMHSMIKFTGVYSWLVKNSIKTTSTLFVLFQVILVWVDEVKSNLVQLREVSYAIYITKTAVVGYQP